MPESAPPLRAAALVLAAGESRRMGTPKGLLDWSGRALFRHQVAELHDAGCDPVVLVVGARAAVYRTALASTPGVRVVENAAYRSGRASSVRLGASLASDDVEALVVTNVDQPCRAATVRRLLAAAAAAPEAAVVVPRFAGRNGHPVLFRAALLPEIRAVKEATEGLRALRRAYAAATVFLDTEDPLVTLDLNTPEAYAAAHDRYGRGSRGPGGNRPPG